MKIKCPYCGVEKEVVRENITGRNPKVTQCDNSRCGRFFGVKVKATYTPVTYKMEEVKDG